MAKEMLINVSEGEECRIALLDEGKLEELYMERTSSTSHVGNIYKGKVTNVEASIQAAFVDFGLGRNGFLHISDLMPSYFGRKGEDIAHGARHEVAFGVKLHRPGAAGALLLDLHPQPREVGEVALNLRLGLADAGGADDEADAFRRLERVEDRAQAAELLLVLNLL